MAYIYKITNDINQKIYIGKTEFSIEKRFKEHCSDAFRKKNEKRPLYAAMRKYGIEHFYIELIEETNQPEEREVYWIEQYRSFKNGYNATKGGDGKRYVDYDLVIATYNELKSINQTAKNLSLDASTVSKILHANNIKILTQQEAAKKFNKKPIIMLDLQHNFIKIFNSATDAAKYLIENNQIKCEISTARSHISAVCNNKRKTAYNYIWKFADVV